MFICLGLVMGMTVPKKIDLVLSKDPFVREVLPPPAGPSPKKSSSGGWIWRERVEKNSICIDPVLCLCLAPDSLIHLMDLFPSGPLAPDPIPGPSVCYRPPVIPSATDNAHIHNSHCRSCVSIINICLLQTCHYLGSFVWVFYT